MSNEYQNLNLSDVSLGPVFDPQIHQDLSGPTEYTV